MIRKDNLNVHIHPFFTKVERPAKLLDVESLMGCSIGLAKRIKKCRDKSKRDKLKEIKKEIDQLLDML